MSKIHIKGSKKDEFYEVDLDLVTCTCRDFVYRRSHYDIGYEERLCKHLKDAMSLSQEFIELPRESELHNYTTVADNSLYLTREILHDKLSSSQNVALFDICTPIVVDGIPVLPVVVMGIYEDPDESLITICNDSVPTMIGKDLMIDKMGSHHLVVGVNFDLKIDFILATDNFDYMTLYKSCSREFYIKLVSIANKKSIRLTAIGFEDIKSKERFGQSWTESEIFDYLGLPYLDKRNRK